MLDNKAMPVSKNSKAKSTTRSEITVPNNSSTGMPSVWLRAPQRASSPLRGTNALEK